MGAGQVNIRWQPGDVLSAVKLDAMSSRIIAGAIGGRTARRVGHGGTEIYIPYPIPEYLRAFGYSVLRGSDAGKVKIFNCYVQHSDLVTPQSDWYTCSDTTLTLTASKYSLVHAKFNMTSAPFTLSIEKAEGATVIDALNAMDQAADIPRMALIVFYRDASNNVTLSVDMRTAWQILPIEAV